ncbi:MAG: hypothetical protein IPN53_16995 [Comamonadaceae bacterium]|nr:hypothetical protein [Comamonadaceae bacterium]
MKSSSLFIALIATVAFGASAYAAGPTRSQGAAAATNPSKTSTSTKTQAQVHTPGTGLTTPSLRTGAAGGGAGTPNGIHTPGTGLTN